MKASVLFTVKSYKKYVSPFLPRTCRFHPNCSSYCIGTVEKFGALKGLWLFLKRVVKCHPFHHGGYDPVPTDSLEKE